MMDTAQRQLIDRAVALQQAGELDEAEAIYRRVLEGEPKNAGVLHLLGLIAHQRGQNDAAASLIERAIRLSPNIPQFHFNLGTVHASARHLPQAINAYEQALRLKPDHIPAMDNLAACLLQVRRVADAAEHSRRSLTLRGDNAKAATTLGAALMQLGQLDAAQAMLSRAIALAPRAAEPYLRLGLLLAERGEMDRAIDLARRAVAAEPHSAEANGTLALLLQRQGWIEEAVECFRKSLAIKADPVTHSNLLYALWFHPTAPLEEVFASHQAWAARYAEALAPGVEDHSNLRAPERRLRIGYVSPAFGLDPVAGRFIEPVLMHHDRERFEICCYADSALTTPLIERLRGHGGTWRNTSALDDDGFARQVRRDGIDILIDLTSHLAGHRLGGFARRPAPVQISWLGQPTTTGMRAMDYLITDVHLDPPALERPIHHTEELLRLPRSYSSFLIGQDTPAVNDLPAARNGFITFGSTHTHAKLNQRVLRLWAQLMQRVSGSRLLIRLTGGPEANRAFHDHLLRCGIPADRLEIVGRAPGGQHLQLYHRIDITLDTFPYGGYTNSLESLWMGVPFLTLAGQTAVSRFGVSLLSNVFLSDLIAETPESYLERAEALARDVPRLSQIRSELRDRFAASALADHAGVTRDLEEAYRKAWRQWCGA